MIKVITGYKVREGADIQPILSAVRMRKTQYQGFIGAEILQSTRQNARVLEISTWNEEGAWIDWEKSTEWQDLLGQAKELLMDQPMTSVYRMLPMKR